MRTRLFSFVMLVLLLVVAGCERADVAVFTVEGDEPGYRRGKDLIKQGRNQEALSEFLKVIEKRGINNSPESHLEVGILYQFHIKDPISAIYHYRKFRELKPNSQQADLVRQRIDAAVRDFARSLPVQPLENQLDRLDMSELAKRLQIENDKLKLDLAAARAGRILPAQEGETAVEDAPVQNMPARQGPVAVANLSPVQLSNEDDEAVQAPVPVRPPVNPPSRVSQAANTPRPAPTPPPSNRTTGAYRRHVVAKGDTLYSLAQKYYGNRSRWKDIYAANRDVMRSPDDYKIGLELKIPQ